MIIDDLLTKEEQFGFETEVSVLDMGYTKYFIEPLLMAASYGGGKILKVLAEAPSYSTLPILAILKEKFGSHKKGDWRVIASAISTFNRRILQNPRHPELPELFLKVLNKNLTSRTAAIKSQAVCSILVICYVLYAEFGISKADYTQKSIQNVARLIDIQTLKKAENLKAFVDSYTWYAPCESAGFKWKYPSIDPTWNTDLALKVLQTFWPEFSFN